ncbi:MAG TPA: hypothetical protein VNA27_05155 [Rubrobacteraceae bacterium]|nr:hypothetical protein [Rubrobacteraceae bacterium]
MSMSVGAGAGLEENAEEACVGGRTSECRVYPHDAREPLLRTAPGLCVSCRNYLQGYLLAIRLGL